MEVKGVLEKMGRPQEARPQEPFERRPGWKVPQGESVVEIDCDDVRIFETTNMAGDYIEKGVFDIVVGGEKRAWFVRVGKRNTSLWMKIRAAIEKAGKMRGLKIRVTRTGAGMDTEYVVSPLTAPNTAQE